MAEKQCGKCRTIKDMGQFCIQTKSKDGHQGRCKQCAKAYNDRPDVKLEKAIQKRAKYHSDPAFRQREIDAVLRKYREDPVARARHIEGVKKSQKKHRKERLAWAREKYASDPKWRLRTRFSSDLSEAMRGNRFGGAWERMVGYTAGELRAHIERLFQPGMAWENYGEGGWEIDHIVPVSAFNFTSPDDPSFKRCWALSNLQPLWTTDNIKKGRKICA